MKPLDIQKTYNSLVKEKYQSQYEQGRWFSNPLLQDEYAMTLQAIQLHLPAKKIDHCLEVGPGPGTWTKLLLRQNNSQPPHLDLVDISQEMIGLAQKNLPTYPCLRFFVSDFLDFQPDKKYDFFFSIRAIEYLPDKPAAIKKVFQMLTDQGQGFIITKTPKYWRNRLLGRSTSPLHSGQINPRAFINLLRQTGFHNISVYPVIMKFPLLRSPGLNQLLFRLFHRHPLNFTSQFFAESYCLVFQKNKNQIIELYGLPGSGKSTFAKNLVKNSPYQLIAINSKKELLWLNFIFFIQRPLACLLTFNQIIRHSPNWPLFYFKFTNSFLHHHAKYQKALRYSHALIDQGPFQNIISIFDKPLSPTSLASYLHRLPHPHQLLIFDIPEAIRQQNLLQKKYLTRSAFGEQYQTQWLKTAAANDQTFKNLLPALSLNYQLMKDPNQKIYV